MLQNIVRTLRRIRRKYIPDDSMILPFLRSMYRAVIIVFPFFKRRGVPIDIGGIGYFRLHPELAIGAYNYEEWGGGHNAGFRQWVDACREKMIVFDLGAHIGLYALPASRAIHPNGILFAFEPAEANRKFLEHHIRYNNISNIQVISDLVGDQRKYEVPFFETASVHGMNTIAGESVLHKNDAQRFQKTFKNQICLDDFCREQNIKPEVIKIDVEGGELHVLQGAREALAYARPLIFLSVHPTHLQQLNSSAQELYALIIDIGYRVYTIQGEKIDELKKEEYILRPSL